MKDPLVKKLYNLWERLVASNKKLDKVAVLKEACINDGEITLFLILMYDPSITFGVTAKIVDEGEEVESAKEYSLLQLLRKLAERELTGHAARDACYTFCRENFDYYCFLLLIFDRDLKAGIDSKTVHSIDPHLFNLFEVALATNITKHKKGHDLLKEDNYIIERKLDGVRLVAIKQADTVNLYSRTGQKFTCLEQLKKDLMEVPGEWVLDGELAVLKEGKDDFKEAVSKIRRKDEQMTDYTYVVFDVLTIPEFYMQMESPKYSERLSTRLDTMPEVPHVKSIDYRLVEKDPQQITQAMLAAKAAGWEGLIARKDCPYKNGRGWDLLKLKFFEDAEFKVIGFESCMMGMLQEDGTMKQTECLGAMLIDYKGNSVGVGTGFSQEERLEIWNNKEKYLNKTATIQYQGESQDKDGKLSLRIPSFKGFRETGKEML